MALALRLRARLATLMGEARSPAAAERELWAAVEHAYRDEYAELQRMQRRYDRETNHGHRSAEQVNWEARLASDLAAAPTAEPTGSDPIGSGSR